MRFCSHSRNRRQRADPNALPPTRHARASAQRRIGASSGYARQAPTAALPRGGRRRASPHRRPFQAREPRDFLAWARERAIHVDLASPAASPVTPLDPLLQGKRIVYLGESNHFVHEKYAYRLLFLRHLVAAGFHFLGEELAWTDGVWIDRYLSTGREELLDDVATYGYAGAAREDRDDAPRTAWASRTHRCRRSPR